MLVQNYVSEGKKDEEQQPNGKIKLKTPNLELEVNKPNARGTPMLGDSKIAFREVDKKMINQVDEPEDINSDFETRPIPYLDFIENNEEGMNNHVDDPNDANARRQISDCCEYDSEHRGF